MAIHSAIDETTGDNRLIDYWWAYPLLGAITGLCAGLLGVGGATLAVPFMLKRNVSMHEAIGTAAAIGYIVTGMSSALLPAHNLGFVYLPALVGLIVASLVTAPLGVRLAHHTKPIYLRHIFTLVLLLLATRMLFSFFSVLSTLPKYNLAQNSMPPHAGH